MCGRLNAILRILEIIEKLMPGGVSQSEEKAFAALFRASDESSFVTGADIALDGGTTAW
jgi:NAD(P)-dependent dehydrogenase (short-subunit alcohol dehydrogenase family)